MPYVTALFEVYLYGKCIFPPFWPERHPVGIVGLWDCGNCGILRIGNCGILVYSQKPHLHIAVVWIISPTLAMISFSSYVLWSSMSYFFLTLPYYASGLVFFFHLFLSLVRED